MTEITERGIQIPGVWRGRAARYLAVAFLLLHCSCRATALAEETPWRRDIQAARTEALRDERPCVLILHVDSFAL